MSNETAENFWKVFENWVIPDPIAPIRRLYYDDQGHPLFYSAEDLPGKYIDLDPVTYMESSMLVQVVNGRLKKLYALSGIKKLVPNTDTGVSCSPADVCIIVDPTQPHTKWNLKNYDTD
jgi:hypothetical protein